MSLEDNIDGLENDSPSRGRKLDILDSIFSTCHIIGLENDSPSRGRKLWIT